MNHQEPIVCEIIARHQATPQALAEIVSLCAQDTGTTVEIRRQLSRRLAEDSVITLHLPAALAASQHPVWCLACRLACFCPQTRVSVIVTGSDAFTSTHQEPDARSA